MAGIAVYKRYWKHIEDKEKTQREKKRLEAIKVAKNLKNILAQEFDVKRVILFGSILKKDCFTMDSDIDIAVEGLAKESYFRAVARLMMESPFEVDLKPIEELKGLIRHKIADGVMLYEKRKTA